MGCIERLEDPESRLWILDPLVEDEVTPVIILLLVFITLVGV